MALEQMKKELKDTGVFWGGVPALEGEQDGDKWIRNNFKLSESGRVVPEPAQRWAAELCQRALASGQQQASKIGSNSCSSVKPKVKVEGGTASATAGSKAARAASVKVKVESSTASASIESSATKAANVKVKVEGSTASASTESTATTAAKVKLEKECIVRPYMLECAATFNRISEDALNTLKGGDECMEYLRAALLSFPTMKALKKKHGDNT